MQRSGMRMPTTSWNWVRSKVPQRGQLEGGVAYEKHGVGCIVYLPQGEVDFDFGKHGEIDGVDPWRLYLFSSRESSRYGFENQEDFEGCFQIAVDEGHLVGSGGSLFYVANRPRLLAVDVDCRLPGDSLPARNLDIVLVLYCHYFQVAELMLENYDILYAKWKRNDSLSHRKIVDLRIYMSSWLGFLAVTCEGFEGLNMQRLLRDSRPDAFGKLTQKSDVIGTLIKKHRKPLREFRNKTFHLRKDPLAIRDFFASDKNRIPWARELHQAFADFFSAYRLECEFHYSINGRLGELRVGREPSIRYRKW